MSRPDPSVRVIAGPGKRYVAITVSGPGLSVACQAITPAKARAMAEALHAAATEAEMADRGERAGK